jgi:hypothetical protein
MLSAMDARRAGPLAVAAVVLGFLGWQTLRNRDAKPLEDPEAATGKGPGVAVDRYAVSGRNKQLIGEGEPVEKTPVAGPPMPLPDGHPPLPAGHGMPPPPRDGAGGAPAGEPPVEGDGADARLPFTFAAPAGWKRVPPANSMRLAQWSLSAEGGGEGGEMYVTPPIGGGIEANVARWAKQMGKDSADTRRLTAGGLAITRVDVSGTFGGMAMPGAPPAQSKDGWRLLGAAVETPAGVYFLKGTGPAAVMAREEAAFDAFLASFKPR